jgi:hypothetical protein
MIAFLEFTASAIQKIEKVIRIISQIDFVRK